MSNKYNSRLSNQLIFLKHKQFTGKVKVKDSLGIQWVLYLCLGRLVWSEGGVHPQRAWKRLLDKYCPQVRESNLQINKNIEFECIKYYVLTVLVRKNFINKEVASKLIAIRGKEVIFDLLQSENKQPLNITTETVETSSFTSGIKMLVPLIEIEDILLEAAQASIIWKEKGLQNFSPNLVPKIKQKEVLKNTVSEVIFQNLTKLLDGQRSLRDLAFVMDKDVKKLTISLMPYIKQDLLELIEIQDLKVSHFGINTSLLQKRISQAKKPLIICVDDSPQICSIMNQIITQAGYRFLGVQQAIQAVPNLISHKPDLVFLDIGMPIVNGYEICAQIRKVSQIKHIPIVILTGNDGIVDRVRAKVVGANAFVSKPIEIEKIMQAIEENISSNSTLKKPLKNAVVSS